VAWDQGLDKAGVAYKIASAKENRIRVIAGPGTGKSYAMHPPPMSGLSAWIIGPIRTPHKVLRPGYRRQEAAGRHVIVPGSTENC
jgi:hypothetical protein